MSKRHKLVLSAVVSCVVLVGLWASAQGHSGRMNGEALLGEVAGAVKVLAFNTDKPVRDVRVVVDGREAALERFVSKEKGLKIGIVRHDANIDVYCEIEHTGRRMTVSYRVPREANLLQPEYLGPGTNVTIKGWTQIYGLSQRIGNTNVLYDLRVEIK